jgi:hypothetical protein
MKQIISILTLLFLLSCSNNETSTSSSTEAVKAELEVLLDDFLKGASVNNAEMHDRFWAEDLIYTSSAGERITKQDIMTGFESDNSAEDSGGPEYGYEDLQIMVFGDAAVVAFRLVGTVESGDQADVMNYYNTGTFINRNSQWQAVAWQATRIPE